MATSDDSAQAPDGPSSLPLIAVTGLAVISSVLGRALAPALPGSVAGITWWIKVFDWLSGFSAQLFAIVGILLAARSVGNTVRSTEQDLLYKLIAVPATVLVGFLVMTRMRLDYSEPRGALALALASGSLALAAAPRLVQLERTRAIGFVLILTGIGSLLHAVAQGLALQANFEALPARFTAARVLETATFALSLFAAALTAAWLFGKSQTGLLKIVGLVVLAALLTHAALRGSDPQAALHEVLASRSLGFLLRDPAPFLPSYLRGVGVLFQLLLAASVLLVRRQAPNVRLVLCLCLTCAGATDIPLLALCLTLATLVAREHSAPPAVVTRNENHHHV